MLDDASLFHDLDLHALHRRRGVKWSQYGPDVLPAWVADMDFPVAPVVRDALRAAIEADDLGYPPAGAATGLPEAYAKRAAERWGLEVDPALVQVLPDVMRGVELCLDCFTAPGDAVVVTTPVYPPFLRVVEGHGRVLAESPLTAEWRVDLPGMAEVFARHRPRLVLLCNPHNPTGRVLTMEELQGIAALALAYGAVVVSDEIHADLLFDGAHVPFATLGPEIAARTVTLYSASKAFNLAGLRCAVSAAGSGALHDALVAKGEIIHDAVGALGVTGALAAWTPEGDEWLAACVRVLDRNRQRIVERLAGSGIGCTPPEATYLAWLDCRRLGLGDDPAQWFLEHAKVALSHGPDFGPPGRGFARLNFATSPAIVDALLDRMLAAP